MIPVENTLREMYRKVIEARQRQEETASGRRRTGGSPVPLRMEPDADREAIDVAAGYATRDWRKALAFTDAFDAARARIAADPTSLPLHPEAVGPEAPFKTVAGFPYLAPFRPTDPAETVVLAVLHTAAGPGGPRRAERRG